MTTLHEAAQQALEALELAVHQNSHDMILTGEELRDGEAAIEALRSALAQQGEPVAEVYIAGTFKTNIGTGGREMYSSTIYSTQPLKQGDKLYAGAAPAPQAQQGERQPVAWMVTTEKQDGTRETYPITGRYKDVQDVCDFGEPIPLYAGAAPAVQPTCKQDLPVETMQERYVRMCPDSECGRKKRCTRMVGVSCMSRADIAPAAQPDTWTDYGGWTFPIEGGSNV